MKNRLSSYLLCALILLLSSIVFADGSSDEISPAPPSEIVVGDKTYPIHLVWIDLNDPSIKVDLALAKDKIGTVDSLMTLSQTSDADEAVIAAINASFFNMKPDSQPASTLIIDGAIAHIAEGGSIVGFDGDNRMHSAALDIVIEGSVNNQWEAPYNWTSWNINHLFYQPEALMIFNNHYTGEFPTDPVYVVAVAQHEVVGKYDYIPEIPANGYIIVRRTAQFLDLFKIGDRVDFKMRAVSRDNSDQFADDGLADFINIENAAGAGPMLIKNGQIVLNAKAEGFQIGKFNRGAAKRSLIGVTADNQLALLVSEQPITLAELTAIAQQIGLIEAFNLDGGGSSGLIYNGTYLVEPERKISNAFVIKKLTEQPIRLVLNDRETYFDSYPFIYAPDGSQPRTMVPLRGILECIDATVAWRDQDDSIVVKRFGSEIVFRVGQSAVSVDGKDYQMDVPLLIHKGRSYVSVRFLTEFFGGTVSWDSAKKIVNLTLPTVESNYAIAEDYLADQQFAKALDQYQKVLNMFPNHVSALKKSAYIHDVILNDLRSALVYYQRIVDVFPADPAGYNQLANTYQRLNLIDRAIEIYRQSNRVADNIEAHFQLVQIYRTNDRHLALEHAQWLLDNAADVKQYKRAEQLLKDLKD